jgi:hypothetical protein
MTAEVARGTGEVIGAVWGATEVMGAARGVGEVGEASDVGVTKGRAV